MNDLLKRLEENLKLRKNVIKRRDSFIGHILKHIYRLIRRLVYMQQITLDIHVLQFLSEVLDFSRVTYQKYRIVHPWVHNS